MTSLPGQTHYTRGDEPVSRAGWTTAVCGERVNEHWGDVDHEAPTCYKCRAWLTERNRPIAVNGTRLQ
jgi:hypothetical protein